MVLSFDVGYSGVLGLVFGVDLIVWLDYGYKVVEKLMLMVKELIFIVYGKGFDCFYFGGCLNGGCYIFNIFVCMLDEYDGYFVGVFGFRLFFVVIVNIFGV